MQFKDAFLPCAAKLPVKALQRVADEALDVLSAAQRWLHLLQFLGHLVRFNAVLRKVRPRFAFTVGGLLPLRMKAADLGIGLLEL